MYLIAPVEARENARSPRNDFDIILLVSLGEILTLSVLRLTLSVLLRPVDGYERDVRAWGREKRQRDLGGGGCIRGPDLHRSEFHIHSPHAVGFYVEDASNWINLLISMYLTFFFP